VILLLKILAPSALGTIFLCQCSPQHGEDEGPVRHGAPQDAAPFLQGSPGEASLFILYFRSALSLFCQLGRIFFYLSSSLILVFFTAILLSPLLCKLWPRCGEK
jgi:hypothetical protein